MTWLSILVPVPGGIYSGAYGVPIDDDLDFLLDADSHGITCRGSWCPRSDVLIVPLPDPKGSP